MLCLLERISAFRDLESEILNLKSNAESISKQLGGWIRSLNDSSLKGQRYVTEKTRRVDEARRGREEFLRKLERIRTVQAPVLENNVVNEIGRAHV